MTFAKSKQAHLRKNVPVKGKMAFVQKKKNHSKKEDLCKKLVPCKKTETLQEKKKEDPCKGTENPC